MSGCSPWMVQVGLLGFFDSESEGTLMAGKSLFGFKELLEELDSRIILWELFEERGDLIILPLIIAGKEFLECIDQRLNLPPQEIPLINFPLEILDCFPQAFVFLIRTHGARYRRFGAGGQRLYNYTL